MTQRRSFGNADGISIGGVRLLAGAGTPEAAVTAPIGSLYLRTNGGAATTLYVKESGTGNTGWTAVGDAAADSVVGTKLYDNTLGSNGSWDVQDSDLLTGTFAAYERLVLHLYNIRGTVAATSDNLYLMFGTGVGGALDTTVGNYSFERLFGEDATPLSSRGDTPLIGVCAAANSEANVVSDITIEILNPGSSKWKNAMSRSMARLSASSQQIRKSYVVWENTGTITRVGIRTDNHATDLLATGARLVIVGYSLT